MKNLKNVQMKKDGKNEKMHSERRRFVLLCGGAARWVNPSLQSAIAGSRYLAGARSSSTVNVSVTVSLYIENTTLVYHMIFFVESLWHATMSFFAVDDEDQRTTSSRSRDEHFHNTHESLNVATLVHCHRELTSPSGALI